MMWTAFLKFKDGSIEEIDVKAGSKKEAKRKALKEQEEHYNGRGKIVRIEQRFGLFY